LFPCHIVNEHDNKLKLENGLKTTWLNRNLLTAFRLARNVLYHICYSVSSTEITEFSSHYYTCGYIYSFAKHIKKHHHIILVSRIMP